MPQLEQFEIFSSLVFWSAISFAILFFLLNKYAFPPIMAILQERESKIRGDISSAEKLRDEARLLREGLEKELKQAHEKAATIIAMAEQESRKIADRTLHETQAKCKQMQDEAANEIKRGHDKLLAEIRGHVAALTIASTEKVLLRALADEDRKRLAEESIEEVLREMQKKSAA